MKPLMIHVERAVRPVRAEESTKCNMRDELYAHITSIYEEELQRTGDEDAAIEGACRRFGEPDDLTVELQASIQWIERVAARSDALVRRRRNETVLRHALRMAGTCLLGYTVLGVVTFTAVHFLALVGVDPGSGNRSGQFALRLRMTASLGGWFVVNSGAFTLIGYAMRSQVEAGLLRPRSFLVTGGLCALTALTVLVTGWGFLLSLPGIDLGISLALLPRWVVLAGLTPLGFVIVARLAAIEMVRSKPWTSLDIDD
ncbi:MAG: hypothetical protein ACC628_10560 [Pirellulaceae bacterium]